MKSAIARYLRVKQFILEGIQTNHWLPSDKIPSENELTLLCSVSRMTAKRALDELTQEGILERLQGLGTFVKVPVASSSLLKITDISHDIRLRNHRHTSQLLKLESKTFKQSSQFPEIIPSGNTVFYSELLHFENDLPIQLEQRIINPALAPSYLEQNFLEESPSDYLLKTIPITAAQQKVAATLASLQICQHLQIAISQPCLVLHRKTWSGSQWATINTFYHPGNRYQLESNITQEISL
ncbi:MAG: histidine utilization repressor [Gammaproteobacteria bacterium CG22_combo_CG10-13_8_21_14_all_40_8]|nr:MAG: histidine utilization repressor [Gammaproteobacteria bacterium CG22_combo_CG10-13_8_21_14_all_40_8]